MIGSKALSRSSLLSETGRKCWFGSFTRRLRIFFFINLGTGARSPIGFRSDWISLLLFGFSGTVFTLVMVLNCCPCKSNSGPARSRRRDVEALTGNEFQMEELNHPADDKMDL